MTRVWPEYLDSFLESAIDDSRSRTPQVELRISFLVERGLVRMPLSLLCRLLGVNKRKMQRAMNDHPDMRAAGEWQVLGRQRFKVYPFWVIHHFWSIHKKEKLCKNKETLIRSSGSHRSAGRSEKP